MKRFVVVRAEGYMTSRPASSVFVYTKTILRCKMLVGKSQTLSDLHRTDAGCAFLQNAFWCAVEARSHHGSMIITGFEVSQ